MLLSGHLHCQTKMILFIILYMTLFFEMTSNIKNFALRCGSSGFPKKPPFSQDRIIFLIYSVMIERVKLSKISSLYILAIGRLLWEILYLYNRPLSLFHPSPSIIMSVTWEDQTTSSASFSRIAISIEVEFKSIYSPRFSWGKVFKSEFKHQLKFVSFSLHATVQQKRPEF